MIQIISGSRNHDGKTAKAIDSLVRGINAAKETSSITYLPERNLERCRQCDPDGWGQCRDGSGCVIDDDLSSLVNAIKESDGVIFASPVYFSDMSESLRGFLDRFRRFAFKAGGTEGVTAKSALLMCVAGGGGGGSQQCLAQMEKVVFTIGFAISDAVPVRRQNLEKKSMALEHTGRWFAEECSGS